MSAQIKTFDCYEAAGYEDAEALYVLHTDHLAAMAAASAYDEEKERALFETAFHVVDLAGSRDSWSGRWKYDYGHVDDLWFGWLACAKARAKRFVGE